MSKNRRRKPRGRHSSVRNVPLRTHWLLLSTLVLMLSAALLLQGYSRHMFDRRADGVPRARGPAAAVPAQIASGGPVIDAVATRSARPAERTIALTFDDGPDPVWTPEILDVLRRNDVHATFFTVGTQVAAHPDLARRIVTEGHQIGLHTFTHTDLGAAPAWRRSLELRESQLAVAGATGVTT
ncbi:polysaccharide deacetylase family protein, partial [Kitasatospora indigofera]|uniref:polysaccharide deacetylase family protein n=1 Tax=Kitasatospora indigofera TaxID=67307 RepID=UPI001E3ADD74